MNNGKICVSVSAETLDEIVSKLELAERCADVIELRIDCLDMGEIDYVFGHLPFLKKNFFVHPANQTARGYWDISPEEHRQFTEWLGSSANSMVDFEYSPQLQVPVSRNGLITVVSLHDFGGKMGTIETAREMMDNLNGSIIKIAVQSDDITDTIPVWNLLKRTKSSGRPVIPIAMGEAGKWTRILGLAHGAFMTYAALDEGAETAPGQITAKDLSEVYRVRELDLDTKVYGVIGDPVSESLSPYMHNPAFVGQNINAVFIPLQVKDLDEFIRRMVRPGTREVELNFGGFSVTMPHKQAIIKHLDAIEPTAERIGAVNTVKIEEGKLTGYNTDAYGFVRPLKERLGDLKGARVAVFGAGGAARACVFALRQESADVTVFACDMQKTKAVASEFNIRSEALTTDRRPLTTDIVVNATPLGMKGPLENESLFTATQLEGVKFVYDLVTMPTDTLLIREAKKANIPAIGGVEMLLAQGAKQFEIWTGQAAPVETMKEAIFKKIGRTRE